MFRCVFACIGVSVCLLANFVLSIWREIIFISNNNNIRPNNVLDFDVIYFAQKIKINNLIRTKHREYISYVKKKMQRIQENLFSNYFKLKMF